MANASFAHPTAGSRFLRHRCASAAHRSLLSQRPRSTKHLPDIEIIVKDYHSGAGRKTVQIPKELHYLTDYYGGRGQIAVLDFHRYYHFGKTFEDIEEDIAALKPDVVGISSLFTPYFREALEVAARVKKASNAIVVMGGSHASAVPESLLASAHVDYVIRGEGERPFVEFLRCLQDHTAGRNCCQSRLTNVMASLSSTQSKTTFPSKSCRCRI